MIKCEYCQTNNKDTALECRKCGAPLPDETSFNGWINDKLEYGSDSSITYSPSPGVVIHGVDGESVVEFNSDGSAIFKNGDVKLADEFVEKYPDTPVVNKTGMVKLSEGQAWHQFGEGGSSD